MHDALEEFFVVFFLFFKQPRWVLLVTGLAYFF